MRFEQIQPRAKPELDPEIGTELDSEQPKPSPEKRTTVKQLKGYDSSNPLHATWSRVLSRAAYEAKRRGLSWTITKEYAWDLIVKQHWRCALTGVPFTPAGTRSDTQASLDRIDSSRGYEPGNVQYVTLRVNYTKREMPEAKFIELCKQVAAHAGK